MEKLRFYHIRKKEMIYDECLDVNCGDIILARGGQTIVIANNHGINNETRDEKEITFKVGVSFCHEEDNFNKKIGREVALGRLEETKFIVIPAIFDDNITRLTLESEKFIINVTYKEGKLYVDNAWRT